MAIKGQQIVITYQAWDLNTASPLAGDVSNHTCRLSIDGANLVTATNTPTELGYGVYAITLTASETNCNALTLQVSSSTTTVVIPSVQITFNPSSSAPSASDIATAVWGAQTRTVTNTIPSASDISDAVWTKDLDTYSYVTPAGMAYKYITEDSTVLANISTNVIDLPEDVWGYSRGRTLTAATLASGSLAKASDLSGLSTFDPTNDTVLIDATQAAGMTTATGFATPSDIPTSDIAAIKAKTDNLPSSPAAVGSAMTLTSTYDAAKTAAQAGDAMTLTAAYDAAKTAAQAGDAMTLTSAYDAAKTASQLTSADLSGLSTFDPTTDTVLIDATQAATMTTATGFATSSDISGAVSALETYGDNHWTGGGSGGATAQQIWEYSGGRTLTASPTDVSGLATSSALSAVASDVSAVKAKTDNLPASPAAVGSAMTLTSAYDAAKTAAQAGDAMTLTSAYDAAKTAAQAGDAMTLTSAYDAAKTAAQAGDAMTLTSTYDAAKTASQLTSADLPSDYAKPGDAMTLTSAYDAAKTASQLTSADLSGLSTFDPTTDTVLIDATQAATMTTATGFATSSDISGAVSALETYGDNHWTGGSSGGATAQQVWEYPGARTLTASPTDVSGLATASALSAVASNVAAVKAKTDNLPASPAATGDIPSVASIQSGLAKTSDLSGLSTFDPTTDTVLIDATQAAGMATATGFATPSDIPTDYAKASDIPTSDISAIKAKTDNLPASPAATGDIPTSKINSVYAGIYNWRLQNNGTVEKITAKDASGNTLAQSTITRDNDGNIIRMDEETE